MSYKWASKCLQMSVYNEMSCIWKDIYSAQMEKTPKVSILLEEIAPSEIPIRLLTLALDHLFF